MNVISLKTVLKSWSDSMDRRDAGSGYVFSGMTPTANGAATLQVDVATGVYARNSANARVSYAGGNITPGAAHATNPRYDIVYFTSGGTLTVGAGTAAAANPVPIAWPAGSCPIAICFIPANATDYTTGGYVFDCTVQKTTAMTTLGDLLVADTAGFPIRLGIGGNGAFLNVSGGALRWGNTIDTGGLLISAGNLNLGAAASRIVPGATSLSLRNNADNADNLIITDAGAVTVRSDITALRYIASFTSATLPGLSLGGNSGIYDGGAGVLAVSASGADANIRFGSSYISIGPNPSMVGGVRLPNAAGNRVSFRNAANSGEGGFVYLDASNIMRMADNGTDRPMNTAVTDGAGHLAFSTRYWQAQ